MSNDKSTPAHTTTSARKRLDWSLFSIPLWVVRPARDILRTIIKIHEAEQVHNCGGLCSRRLTGCACVCIYACTFCENASHYTLCLHTITAHRLRSNLRVVGQRSVIKSIREIIDESHRASSNNSIAQGLFSRGTKPRPALVD
jgi:hypothetical protein